MFDIFEYPNITAKNVDELAQQVNHYLVQFKETLEFALVNIGTDNLSADLIAKLNSLGADLEKSKEQQEDQIIQVSNNALSVSDVLNSEAYKESLRSLRADMEEDLELTVNYSTGNLEYTIKETEP